MREIELKWKLRNRERFEQGLWKLAVSRDLVWRLRKAIPHYRKLSVAEIRSREGPHMLGRQQSHFERNTMFAMPGGEEVRLRMAGHHAPDGSIHRVFELTTKRHIKDSEFAIREEATLLLGEQPANQLQHFLRGLGWHATDVYENRRTDIHIAGVMVSLRTFPILGEWIEIEGAPDDIRRVAKALGLSMKSAVKVGWRTLWKHFCEKHDSYDPHYLTFAAVKGV